MKRQIMTAALVGACVLAFTSMVKADTLGRAGNKDGGTINLTDNTSRACTRVGAGYWVVYATSANVNTDPLRGCWKIVDDNAHILWSNGDERMFPLDRFELTPYGEATYGGEPKKAKPTGTML